ncbi:MAG: hypothetical protein A2096_16515 [Spirochaetes bacterium GWF1_41_5]|nr:MAG: hypothetical protein A2096_16515 [Spirochaetes bacterium GWF1_41_5]HBE04102.1 hypothetical protein [Spirochaetia bacterium]
MKKSICLILLIARAAVFPQTSFLPFIEKINSSPAGNIIIIPDGVYTAENSVKITASGTADKPIIIKTQNPGKAVIRGSSGIVIADASFLIFDGFFFEHEDKTPALSLKNIRNLQILRCRFRLAEPEPRRQHWLYISGASSSNRIAHCLFEEKHNEGNFIALGGTTEPLAMAQYTVIVSNAFINIGPRIENGKEAVRIGDSKTSMSFAFTILENNYFENCDGDPEVISVKSCGNILRFNTLRNCRGGLVLRHGNMNRAEANLFWGNGRKEGLEGMRFYGDDHIIVNNYFFNLTKSSITVENGDYLPAGKPEDVPVSDRKLHHVPRNILIAHNTIINCPTMVISDVQTGKYNIPFEKIIIINNLIWSRSAPAPVIPPGASGLQINNNLGFSDDGITGSGIKGMIIADPEMILRSGIYYLSKNSPAVDRAVSADRQILSDFKNQPRFEKPDIGADEYRETGTAAAPADWQKLTPFTPVFSSLPSDIKY